MTLNQIITWLIVGLIAGWLAGVIVKGRGFGIIGDIVVGILGAFLGNLLLGSTFGLGLLGTIITALIGAIILLVIIKLIKKV